MNVYTAVKHINLYANYTFRSLKIFVEQINLINLM